MDEFKDRLVALRKAASLTQDALAQKLGVTCQAVSKWETGASYPDVTLLPKIAATFGTTVDYLLLGEAPTAADAEAPRPKPAAPVPTPASTPAPAPASASAPDAPSSADAGDAPAVDGPEIAVDVPGELEIRVFCKGRPVGDAKAAGLVRVRLYGRARDVRCEASLACGEIEGDVSVAGNLDCRGDIGGDVAVGANLRVKGDIGGDVAVQGHLACYGDIGGDVEAGSVTAGDIGGDVEAREVTAGEIGGDVSAWTVRRRKDADDGDEEREEEDK